MWVWREEAHLPPGKSPEGLAPCKPCILPWGLLLGTEFEREWSCLSGSSLLLFLEAFKKQKVTSLPLNSLMKVLVVKVLVRGRTPNPPFLWAPRGAC